MVSPPRTRSALGVPDALALGLIAAISVLVRVPGWSNGGLFYDDAWFAFPAKVGLRTAIHLSVTTPGYSLLQRSWILLDPGSTRWAIALPLALGIIAPPMVFLLGRTFKLGIWISSLLATLIAISPVAIEYSVRVKEYEADLVVATVVVLLTELARRRRSATRVAALTVVSALAVGLSASLLIVVVGSWVGLLVIALSDRVRRAAIGIGAACSAAVVLGIGLLIHRHSPPGLTAFWVMSNNLNGPPHSWAKLLQVIGAIAIGIPHGLLGTPSLPTAHFLDLGPTQLTEALIVAAGEVAILVAISVRPVMAILRRRPSDDVRLLPPLAAIGTAVAACLAGFVPMGGGRTDLVLYPSIMVSIGVALSWAAGSLTRAHALGHRSAATRAIKITGATAALVLALGLGWSQRSWYPAQDVQQLSAMIDRAAQPADVLVIAHRNTYTWAYDDLSPWRLHIAKNAIAAGTVGFWVTFKDRRVLAERVSASSSFPFRSGGAPLPGLSPSMRRIWMVGVTYETASPSTKRLTGAWASVPLPSAASRQLEAGGWIKQGPPLEQPGVYAQLMVHP